MNDRIQARNSLLRNMDGIESRMNQALEGTETLPAVGGLCSSAVVAAQGTHEPALADEEPELADRLGGMSLQLGKGATGSQYGRLNLWQLHFSFVCHFSQIQAAKAARNARIGVAYDESDLENLFKRTMPWLGVTDVRTSDSVATNTKASAATAVSLVAAIYATIASIADPTPRAAEAAVGSASKFVNCSNLHSQPQMIPQQMTQNNNQPKAILVAPNLVKELQQKPDIKPSTSALPISKSQAQGVVVPQTYVNAAVQMDYLDSSSSATSVRLSQNDAPLLQNFQMFSFNPSQYCSRTRARIHGLLHRLNSSRCEHSLRCTNMELLEDRLTLLRIGWKLVYVDHENDLLLVGDDPWEEFVNCIRNIKILSPQEVQQMSLDGDLGNGVLPNQACSSSDGGNAWRSGN
ncbi:hypothetical protein NE237_023496 [Protea cynaroides]|uniref:Auxin-responsive protein n=1 Tax=Protea cynaroides TaxID=273540 RepID=A0A9Q0K5G1_9MAGN|nr:hypothetical protein NE237_023496 [Protea cynaroides]